MDELLYDMMDGLGQEELARLLPEDFAVPAPADAAARVRSRVLAALGLEENAPQGAAEAAIKAAPPLRTAPRRPRWLTVMAACLGLLLVGGGTVAVLSRGGFGAGAPQQAPAYSTAAAEAAEPEAAYDAGAAGVDEAPPVAGAGSRLEGGLAIPAVELPRNTEAGVAVDMVGLVVYQGRIYTQGQYLYVDSEARQRQYLGEYLGLANGSIDEWSRQSDFATEFASTVAGEVYAAAGYDLDFRIAMPMAWEEDTAEGGTATIYAVFFFEHLNGITLQNAGGLFADRLQMPGNVVGLQCQSHADWDNARNACYTPNVTQNEIDAFLAELYTAPLEDWGAAARQDIYKRPQAHLYFQLADGTTVELRLIEGGYVRYEWMGGHIFAAMPGQAFNDMFEACR